MLKNNYQLSPTSKVQYVQKGVADKSNVWYSGFNRKQLFLTLTLLIVLILIAFPLFKNYGQEQAINEEIREAQSEIDKYSAKNKDLKNILEYLESDQAVEEKARLNMGLKKAGEKVIVIKDERNLLAPIDESKKSDNLSNPARWMNYFFK